MQEPMGKVPKLLLPFRQDDTLGVGNGQEEEQNRITVELVSSRSSSTFCCLPLVPVSPFNPVTAHI
jgi:hypothetical protein